MQSSQNLEKATFAGGCFWCTEAVFKRLIGVNTVTPGYAGGDKPNPTYEKVIMETTGHAESIQITFDPSLITYSQLLDVFFATHNPTTLNQQENDRGPQYRSVIFYHTKEQERAALNSIKELELKHVYNDPIVTAIEPYKAFYPAEDYHKDYYDNNRTSPYCMVIIDPKIRKLMEKFRNDVKEEYK